MVERCQISAKKLVLWMVGGLGRDDSLTYCFFFFFFLNLFFFFFFFLFFLFFLFSRRCIGICLMTTWLAWRRIVKKSNSRGFFFLFSFLFFLSFLFFFFFFFENLSSSRVISLLNKENIQIKPSFLPEAKSLVSEPIMTRFSPSFSFFLFL